MRKAIADKLSLGSGLNKQKGMGSMAGRTVRREDLSEAIYQKVGLSRSESAELVGQVLGEICDTLVRSEHVKLSSFGNFVVRSKVERVWLNPKTGVEVSIEKHRVMVSEPSNVLKAHINGKASDG